MIIYYGDNDIDEFEENDDDETIDENEEVDYDDEGYDGDDKADYILGM